ncbi:hypothetical protein MNBD_DELTA01-1316 [hydrothermal vent metagenome]|uniref:Uncharacterized protein n=1 Tax=hydrothermal vent metagenome TaxID=652676 RepID=A0A3B0QUY5_9ZZZZ
MKRTSLMRIHAIIATFFLSVGVMYLVTGGFYTGGIKGGYTSASHQLELSSELRPELDALNKIVVKELNARGIPLPTGKSKIKKGGTSFYLEWTGSNRDVTLSPTTDPMVATLKIKDTSFYRGFVQLHKAKGGKAFKVFAIAWAIGLGVLLLSGSIMALQSPMLRKTSIISAICGFIAFIIFILLS